MILRIIYAKEGMIKFVGHLDLVRIVERAFRRCQLPLAFTQGFNPHPKISFAHPVSVGMTSDYGVIDVELEEAIDPKAFLESDQLRLPNGLVFKDAFILEKSKKLMSMISHAEYMIKCTPEEGIDYDEMNEKLSEFIKQEEIIVEKLNKKKKLKQINIRPLVLNVLLLRDTENLTLRMTVASGSEGNLKADVLLKSFCEFAGVEYGEETVRIHRIMLFGKDGKSLKQLHELL